MRRSLFLMLEDYWSIWIASFILVLGISLFLITSPKGLPQKLQEAEQAIAFNIDKAPYKTIQWFEAYDQLKNSKASAYPVGKLLRKLTAKPSTWSSNPASAFYRKEVVDKRKSIEYSSKLDSIASVADSIRIIAQNKQELSATVNFENEYRNLDAENAIVEWRAVQKVHKNLNDKKEKPAFNLFPSLLLLMIFLGSLFTIGTMIMGKSASTFFKGFVFIFIISTVAFLLGAQSDMKTIGFGYAAWAIILGLLISNTLGTPKWVTPALTTEFYIKTALVILGAEILLSKILSIGLPGIFVSWIVTPIVLVSTYWFGQRILKISSKSLNMTISADMSVCGVSAAVATAAACKASKEELTVAIGLSMIFTSVMMIAMPALINYIGMPEILGGAWIGGTIDATGAVVAAGAFLGEKALSVAATIKMIQNILIGIIAFGVAVYFATNVEKEDKVKVGIGEIWRRFPKFILGFIGASIIFSLIYVALGENLAYTLIDHGVIGSFSKNIRGWLFCIAFVSIGLSINFKELQKHFVGGKSLILYICGQAFNLCLTLLMAYVMFYHVFPHITEKI